MSDDGNLSDESDDNAVRRVIISQKKIGYSPSFVLFQLFGALLHIFDLCYDLYLAVRYYQEGEFVYCTLVSLFGFLSPLCVSLLSCCINYKKENNSFQNPNWLKFLNWICHCLPLAPVARAAELWYHAKKCNSLSIRKNYTEVERKYEHYKWKDKVQAFLLNFESFVESAPQLLLKNYILFNDFNKESTRLHYELHSDDTVDWITIRFNLSYIGSVAGVFFGTLACAWRLTSNRKSGNLSNDNEKHMSYMKHIIPLFIHHLLSLFARFLLLGMLLTLSVRTFWIFCGAHTALNCFILSFQKFRRGRAVFQWKENESSWAQDAFGIVKVIFSSLFSLTDFRFKRAFKLHTTTFCVIPLVVNIALIIYILTSVEPLVPLLLHGFILTASLSSAILFYLKCKDLGLDVNGTEHSQDRGYSVISVTATLKKNWNIFIDRAIERCRRSFSHHRVSYHTRRNSSTPENIVVVGQRYENLSDGISTVQRRKINKKWKDMDEFLRDKDIGDEVKAAIRRKDLKWICLHVKTDLFHVLTLMLAENGVDVNARNEYGRTPAFELCLNYEEEDLSQILDLLIRKGADVEAVDPEYLGRTMLHSVCQNYPHRNIKDVVDLLIQARVPVCYYGETALDLLIEHYKHENMKDVVDLLIKAGVLVDAKDRSGNYTALHLLIMHYKHDNLKDIVDLLIKGGVPMDAKNALERTPLHFLAINYKHENMKDIVDLLIKNGVRVDAVDRNGSTAIHLLAEYYKHGNMKDIVELLIKKGVPVDDKDNIGNTALHYLARSYQHDNMKDMVELLIKKGARVNAKGPDGSTALHWLARCNENDNLGEVVRLLKDKGARLDVQDNYGLTPLMELCGNNNKLKHLGVFSALIPDARDDPLLSDTQSVTRLLKEFGEEKISPGNLYNGLERIHQDVLDKNRKRKYFDLLN